MKQHHKVGNRKGNPAYRTSAVFRYKQNIKIQKSKNKNYNSKLKDRNTFSI